ISSNAILSLDALMVKMRHEGRVENRAAFVGIGVTLEGIGDKARHSRHLPARSPPGAAEPRACHDRTMNLRPYRDTWPADDPHANFKSDVANYTTTDPLPTLERLSAGTGIPVECLIRYVLVKWAASGSDALLAMRPIVFEQ